MLGLADLLEYVFWYGTIGLALVLLAYYMARAASIAHYRTKLEHFRRIKKEAEGELNAKE